MTSSGLLTTMTMAWGGVLLDVVGHAADDLGVFQEKIVAAHAGLAGQAAGDDDDVGPGVVGRVVGPLHVAVEAFEAGRLEHVERLALGHAFDDVVQDDVAQFLFGQALRGGGADKSGSDDGDLHSSICVNGGWDGVPAT